MKMHKTVFRINKMDCPSEEQIIRMKLDDLSNVNSLEFDIANRQLSVFHNEDFELILQRLDSLNFDTHLVESNLLSEYEQVRTDDKKDKKILIQVLIINFFFFVLEIFTGYLSHSLGLIADSLDMLADSIVYGLALFAVSGTILLKKKIAKVSGYFQLLLSIIGLLEVIRRFIGLEEVADFKIMIIISLFALLGNIASLYLLQKSQNKEAHLQASLIFTSNDIIVNIGVILAGGFVFMTNSNIPDLIIGIIIFVIVAKGAFKILKLSK